MSEIEALRRYVDSGDPDAFRVLVERYGGMVYATCVRLLGRSGEAEDATQETFLKLAKHAARVRSNLTGWLYAAATSTCRDMQRRAVRHVARDAAAARPEGVKDTELASRELREALDAALGELSAAERELIVERYLVGRPLGELAAEAGVSEPSMSRRVSRALEVLREKLHAKGLTAGAATLVALVEREAEAVLPDELAQGLARIGVSGVGSVAGSSLVVKVALTSIAIVSLTLAAFGLSSVLRGVSPTTSAPPPISTMSTVVYDVWTTAYDATGAHVSTFAASREWRREDGSSRREIRDSGNPAVVRELSTTLFPPGVGRVHTQIFYDQQQWSRIEDRVHSSATYERADNTGPVSVLYYQVRRIITQEKYHRGPVSIDGKRFMLFEAPLAELTPTEDDSARSELARALRARDAARLQEVQGVIPPWRVWVDPATQLPMRWEEPVILGRPESGYRVRTVAVTAWNEGLADDLFVVDPPSDWAWSELVHVIVGDHERTAVVDEMGGISHGLTLRKGVVFRLFDTEGRALATEADVLGIRGFSIFRSSDAERRAEANLVLASAAQERIATALGDEESAVWRFQLGTEMNGEVTVSSRASLNMLGEGAWIEGFPIGSLGADAFIDQYLELPQENDK